jgi:hypothetical protein
MKHILYFMILFAGSTLLWNCDKSDEPTTPVTPVTPSKTDTVPTNPDTIPVVVNEPTWTVDLTGTETTAPTWQAPAGGVYQYSMTAIIGLSDFLQSYADNGDIISAFIGNECRGVASPQSVDGKSLFFLYIRGNASETQKITLKYYSVKNKITYTCADLMSFTQNGTYGKASEPAVPPFEESGKYAARMTAVVTLSDTQPFSLRSADIIAAFIGDECRGVGVKSEVNGKTVYSFDILGKKDAEGTVYFKYYSQNKGAIYTSSENFQFSKGGTNGTKDSPFTLTFKL